MPLSGGTVHKPVPRGDDGHPIFESIAGTEYLLERGIEPERILTETTSYDTIGDAYFARVVHCDPTRLRTILVTSSEFHIERVQKIFQFVFGLPTSDGTPAPYTLEFVSTPDTGLEGDVYEAREEREKQSLEKFKETIETQQIETLESFHDWLFREHNVYNAHRHIEVVDQNLAKSN